MKHDFNFYLVVVLEGLLKICKHKIVAFNIGEVVIAFVGGQVENK